MLRIKLFRMVGRSIIFIKCEVESRVRCRRCLGFHKEVIVGKYDFERKVITFHLSVREQQFISNYSLVQAQAQAQAQALALAQARAKYNEAIDREIYGSDLFRMYGFKIKRCTRMYSHDWTQCPYTHQGEKAKRRDPRKYPYAAVICPLFREGVGGCPKGDNCEFSHGLFEFWMHPTKYRTRPCSAGRFCTRRVCFFAHSPDELRSPEPQFNIPNLATKGKMTTTRNSDGNNHQLMMVVGSPSSSSGEGSSSSSRPLQAQFVEPSASQLEEVSSLLESLKTLKLREDEAREMTTTTNNNSNKNKTSFSGGRGVDLKESDLPHLDWIYELLN